MRGTKTNAAGAESQDLVYKIAYNHITYLFSSPGTYIEPREVAIHVDQKLLMLPENFPASESISGA